jgi:hypothetical protein
MAPVRPPDELSDHALLDVFERGALDPAKFEHRHHVRVAWLFLRQLPLPIALERITAGIRRFTQALGQPERYHETITWAFTFVIHDRVQDAPAATWDEFVAANPDLLNWGPVSVLDRYYERETLFSERARRAFVMPDRLRPPVVRLPGTTEVRRG